MALPEILMKSMENGLSEDDFCDSAGLRTILDLAAIPINLL